MRKIKEIFSGPKLTVPETFLETEESRAIVAEVEERVAQSVGYVAARRASIRPFWRRKGAYFIEGYESAYKEGFPTAESREQADISTQELIERAKVRINEDREE